MQEGRGLFPEDLKQHHYSVEQADGPMTKHFGIEYGGAALSTDKTYRELGLEEKAIEIF